MLDPILSDDVLDLGEGRETVGFCPLSCNGPTTPPPRSTCPNVLQATDLVLCCHQVLNHLPVCCGHNLLDVRGFLLQGSSPR